MLGTLGKQEFWARELAEQIRENGRLFFRLAYGVLRNAAAAEDACQAAFCRAWERRSELDGVEKPCAWLAKVVVNESLAAVRRTKSEGRAMAQRAEMTRASLRRDAPRELAPEVLAALEQLPETPRMVVAMRIMQGISGNEVKEILGCSASEVSRQLYVGMERLRELLSDWSGSP